MSRHFFKKIKLDLGRDNPILYLPRYKIIGEIQLKNNDFFVLIYGFIIQIYQSRKETIERIFGTAKEQHGFRYTQYVGKARMEMKAGLTFACMNLKKLAKILEKRGWNTARFLLILKKIKRKEVLNEKWCWA